MGNVPDDGPLKVTPYWACSVSRLPASCSLGVAARKSWLVWS
ncbi:hypothetical protein [Methylomonas koyamae]|nr:hypothetical protein [Methylomonas koyamae]